MNHKKITLIAVLALMLGAIPAMAQRPRVSPHETISANIDDSEVKLVYGRPYSKEPNGTTIREVWGKLVPWGKAWRMGADEATTLTIAKPIMIGSTEIPAGSYTLYLIPQEKEGSKMAFSKKTGQWGIPIDETQDLTRVDAKKESMEKQLDQYAMAIEKGPSGGGVIKLMWEKTQFSVPFTVKK